jgi:hypothetical protein
MKRVVRQFKTVYVGNLADPERAYHHETETVWVNGRRVHHRDNRQGNRDLPSDSPEFLPSFWPEPMAADGLGEDILFPFGDAVRTQELHPRTATVTVHAKPAHAKPAGPTWTQRLQSWGRRVQAAAQAAWQELRRPD